MLLSVLYVSPPCAARAARARSIGEVVGVIAIAGVEYLTPAGATAFAVLSAAFVAVSVWAKTDAEKQNTRANCNNDGRKVFFMRSVLFRVNGEYVCRKLFSLHLFVSAGESPKTRLCCIFAWLSH